MIDAKQILTKLHNDKIFNALLSQIPEDKREEVLNAINEIANLGVKAGTNLSSMAAQAAKDAKQPVNENNNGTVKDA